MAKMMHCSPEEVRSWPWSDVVRLLAYSALEREEFDRRVQQNPSASHRASAGGPTTNTTVYRFGPRPTPKR
ncbi:hypothetical protein HI113_22575 [Corallococcus exiguus]|uniref:hypothetical protein n=1 Tax=Corallococcus exiguus TaxID=83462 RepID=UPI0014731445|nr:hypothetical protein [Corallococcus exiguus]MBN8466164.1 hypothetical protein [Corallococcus exiguus]NNB96687.1 hypothetical protein [Corallococcus exiguus]